MFNIETLNVNYILDFEFSPLNRLVSSKVGIYYFYVHSFGLEIKFFGITRFFNQISNPFSFPEFWYRPVFYDNNFSRIHNGIIYLFIFFLIFHTYFWEIQIQISFYRYASVTISIIRLLLMNFRTSY